MWSVACPKIWHKTGYFPDHSVEINISNIFKSYLGVTVIWSSAWVDVDRVVRFLGVFKDRAVAEHVQRALIVQEDTVRVKMSVFVLCVMGDLMETCSWRWLGVIVRSVGGYLTFFLVDLVRVVPDVHDVHPRGCAIYSLHNAVWIASIFLQFFLFVFLERAQPAVISHLPTLVTCDVLYIFTSFYPLPWSLCFTKSKWLLRCKVPPWIYPGLGFHSSIIL